MSNASNASNAVYNKLHALNVLRARKLAAQGQEVKESIQLRRGSKKDGTLEKIEYTRATIVLSPSVLRATAARDGAEVLDVAGMKIPYSGADALIMSDVWHGADVPPETHESIVKEIGKELAFAERVDALYVESNETEPKTEPTATEQRANTPPVKPEKNGKPVASGK